MPTLADTGNLTPDMIDAIKRFLAQPPSYAESEVALPTYRDRLQAMRPVTMDVDPRMVLAPPPTADVNLLDRRALLGTPASQLPSYQDGTDYVPETGPAIVHEGEMIVPADQAEKLRNGTPSITVKAKRLSEDEVKKRWVALGYPAASAEGIARNVIRESGGDPEIIGDDDTSGGLFQHHASRLTDLKAYAKEQGKPWTDPDVQIAFADKELKDKFPALRKSLMENKDPAVAEDAFKRIFERPASVMWENTASGQPVLGTSRYRFSDYALGEHDGRRGTSLMYMDPQDYLDLSPDLAGDPSTSRSGNALRASVGRGDEIEGVPSLDIRANGPTGVVTAQDGRHRALLAQEEGVDAIPVAINQKGAGQPTEIQGMTGRVLPFDFKPASEVTRQASPMGQVLGQTVASVTPAAGDLPAWGSSDQVVESGAPTWGANDAVVDQGQPAAPSTWESFKTGLLDLPVAAAQLVGNVAAVLGGFLPGKQGEEARDFTNRLNAAVAAREGRYEAGRGPDAGVDWARLGGNVVGSVPLSALGAVGAGGGLAARLGGAAVAGGLGGAAQPVTEGPFWQGKGEQAAVGAAAGGTLGALGAGMARTLGPAIGSAARRLMNEGVILTPGQMAGGALRRAEDAMLSIPGLGAVVRAAQRRSIESFNVAAVNRSLGDLGIKLPDGVATGRDAIDFAQNAFSKAYDAVIPHMQGADDQQLRADLLNVVANATNQNLPAEYMEQLHHIIGNEIVSRFNAGGGRITGTDAQQIGTQLDALIKAMRISPNPYQQTLGRLLRDVDSAMDKMMERNNPQLQPIKDRIDSGYAKFKIIQDASQSARNTGESPEGNFTPAQLSNAVRRRDRSKDKAAFARGDALMQDLSDAAKNVLPQKVPDSGTTERGLFAGSLLGLAHFEPHIAAGVGLGALPYTRAGLAAVNRAASSPATKNFLANLGRGSGTLGALTAPRGDVQFDIQSITPGGPPSPQPGP